MLRVVAHVLLACCSSPQNTWFPDPQSFFLTYWFLEILRTFSCISREMAPAVDTIAFLGHALLSDAQLRKIFCCWCPIRGEIKDQATDFQRKIPETDFPIFIFHMDKGERSPGERIWWEGFLGRALLWILYLSVEWWETVSGTSGFWYDFPVINGGHSGLVNSSFRKLM